MNIVLTEGYTEQAKEGPLTHRNVTFGRRLDGATLLRLDEDPQSEIPTQFKLLTVAATITAFGTLTMPVPLAVLLQLDYTEIEDLVAAHNKFMAEGAEGRKAEFVSDSKVRLAFGYESNGLNYTQVEFGHRLNGYDMVEADKTGFATMRREYFLIGREIIKLSTADGAYSLPGPFGLEMFEKLDGQDFVMLRMAAVRWRQSFRTRGSSVQKGVAGAGGASRPQVSLDGGTDSQSG